MKYHNDEDISEILLHYKVHEPGPELVINTKQLMHEEMSKLYHEPSRQAEWVLVLVGLSIIMSLCIFYMFTVGTILKLTLPSSYLTDFLGHSMFVLTGAGGSLLAGLLMLLLFKQFMIKKQNTLVYFSDSTNGSY